MHGETVKINSTVFVKLTEPLKIVSSILMGEGGIRFVSENIGGPPTKVRRSVDCISLLYNNIVGQCN